MANKLTRVTIIPAVVPKEPLTWEEQVEVPLSLRMDYWGKPLKSQSPFKLYRIKYQVPQMDQGGNITYKTAYRYLYLTTNEYSRYLKNGYIDGTRKYEIEGGQSNKPKTKTGRKLKSFDRAKALELRNSGATYREISRTFGIGQGTLTKLLRDFS